MTAQNQQVELSLHQRGEPGVSNHDIACEEQSSQVLIDGFKSLYQTLNAQTIGQGLIESVYDEQMHFEDSFHSLDGRDAFVAYCESLYENVQHIAFEFHEQWLKSGQAMLTWTMTYRHPRLNRGRDIVVQGATQLRFGEKITFHQDFFDGGQLLYEHIPMLGTLIQGLKKRLC